MHTLTNWTTRRSGAHVVVRGYDEKGEVVKFTASRVEGPQPARMCRPKETLAIKLDGTPVTLAGEPLSNAEKVKRVGAAVSELANELMKEEGGGPAARDLTSAFAHMPTESMARLHDLLLA